MPVTERFLLLEFIGCEDELSAQNALAAAAPAAHALSSSSSTPPPLPPPEEQLVQQLLQQLENTTQAEQQPPDASVSLMQTAVQVASLLLSLFNVFSNLASLLVFAHWKKRPVVQLLIFLCAAETLFNLGYFSVFMIFDSIRVRLPSLLDNWTLKLLYGLLLPLSSLLANSCVLIRNWAVALMAVARYEAVRWPLRPKKVCEGRSLGAIIAAICVVSGAVGSVRLFEQSYRIYSCAGNAIEPVNMLISNEIYRNVMGIIGFTVLQAFGPIGTVLVFSVSLIYELRRARLDMPRKASRSPADARRANSLGSVTARASSSSSRDKEESADRTVIVLCVLFCVLETPQSILSTLARQINIEFSSLTVAVFNMVLLIDSTSNLAVYAIMNRRFRVTFWALLHCQCDAHVHERNQRARLSSAAITASTARSCSRLSQPASSPSLFARSPHAHNAAGRAHATGPSRGAPSGIYTRASCSQGRSLNAAAPPRSQSIPNTSMSSCSAIAFGSDQRRGSCDTAANGNRCSSIGGLETIEEARSIDLESCACSSSHVVDSATPVECELVSY